MTQKVATYRLSRVMLAMFISEFALAAILFGAWLFVTKQYETAFQFANPWALYALGATPVLSLVFVFIIRWKNGALKALADIPLLRRLIPDFSHLKAVLKFILLKLGIVCLIVGMARPQYGIDEVETVTKGADILLAVDVSNSMLAQDLSPNRLDRAKLAIEQLVNQLKGERIGIITFAGVSDLHVAVTNDYRSVKSFLGSVNNDFPVQGTAIGNALELAIKSFDQESASAKVVIIISDGENHEDDAVKAAEKADELGIVVHTIGLGSPDGVPIPAGNGRSADFRKDEDGNTVVTKLNEGMMRQIADAGSGIYVRATNADLGLNIIMQEINKMDGEEGSKTLFQDYREHFQFFLILGLIFLMLDVCISDKRNTWTENVNLFG
jgi:Ca-activated chloride channel family protein